MLDVQIGIPPFPLSIFKPNPDLNPEEISTRDLGGEYQISPAVSMKADFYRSRLHDFIVIGQHFARAGGNAVLTAKAQDVARIPPTMANEIDALLQEHRSFPPGGRIMRRLLRDIAEGRALGGVTTLADPTVVARLKDKYEDES